MSNKSSPGLYVNETDFQQFAVATSGTRACILGAATKGPVGKPTLITSQGSFIQKFGKPLLTDMGAQAAMQFLAQGNALIYVRVAHSPVVANVTANGTTGGTPAAAATGTVVFAGGAQPADGNTIVIGDGTVSKTFEFDSNSAFGAGNIGVTIGGTAAATMTNLITAINNSPLNILAADTTVTVPRAGLTNKTGGTAGNVTITATGVNITVTGMAGGTAAIAGSTAAVTTFYAISPGSWANGLQVQVVNPSVVTGAPAGTYDVLVQELDASGVAVVRERWTQLSNDPASPRYIDTAFVNGIPDEIGPSQYLAPDGFVLGSPNAGTYTLGQGGGAVGTDGTAGLVAADYIGTVSGTTATGLVAVSNPEATDYNVIAIPGRTDAATINALIAHCETRRDCLAVIDAPFGLSSDTVVAWANGQQPGGVPNAPAAALNSSFAAVFWPWVLQYDPFNKKNVWMPPSGFVLQVMVVSDSASGPWMPAAGPTRGAIRAIDIETSPNQAQRDTLVGDNFVNPFVNFSDVGIVLYGNKTLQRTATATQSIATRRMLIYAQKLIRASIRYLVMEPNDPITQQRFEAMCNTPLSNIANQRGLQQFRVVCNASTNPPELAQQKTLRGQLIIQPTDFAEKVQMDFSLTSSGAAFGVAKPAGV